MAKTIAIKVEVVPTKGTPENKILNVKASGASVKEILDQAKIAHENKDIYVNDKLASLDTHVGAQDTVSARAKSAPAQYDPASSPSIRVQERPQGS